MDERAPKPPLADDPGFMDSLLDLDQGLIDDPTPARKTAPPSLPTHRAPLPDEPSNRLTPEASAALAAASAALDAFGAPPEPETTGATDVSRPRKPIDLFPPAKPQARSAVPPARPNTPAARVTAPAVVAPPATSLPSHDRVLRELTAAIGRHDGTILLTGEFGAGKTALCRAVVDQLGRRTLVSFTTEPFATIEELLKTVLVDFGVISRADIVSGRLNDASTSDLAGKLRRFLGPLAALQAVALIVIDDAQKLPASVLRKLPLLAEMAGDQKQLQLVLVGEPAFATLLRSPEFQKLNGSIGLRAELGPIAAMGQPSPVRGPAPSSWPGRVLTAALLIGLMLAGAAGAGWLFRGPLARVLARWHVVGYGPSLSR